MNGASSRPLHRESPADGSLRGVSSRLPCEQTACSSLSSGEVRLSRSCVCFGGSVLHGREVCRFCGDLRRAIPFCGPIRLVCHWVVGEFGLAFASHMTYADLQSTGSAGERTGYACCLFQLFLVKKTWTILKAMKHVGFCPSIRQVCMKPWNPRRDHGRVPFLIITERFPCSGRSGRRTSAYIFSVDVARQASGERGMQLQRHCGLQIACGAREHSDAASQCFGEVPIAAVY